MGAKISGWKVTGLGATERTQKYWRNRMEWTHPLKISKLLKTDTEIPHILSAFKVASVEDDIIELKRKTYYNLYTLNYWILAILWFWDNFFIQSYEQIVEDHIIDFLLIHLIKVLKLCTILLFDSSMMSFEHHYRFI